MRIRALEYTSGSCKYGKGGNIFDHLRNSAAWSKASAQQRCHIRLPCLSEGALQNSQTAEQNPLLTSSYCTTI